MAARDLTIVKARLEVPEGRRYKPNDSDESRHFEAFYGLYKKLYPDNDEREPKRKMISIASGQQDEEDATSNLYYAFRDGKLVGYNQFDVIASGPREEGAIALDWYLGIDPKERRNGYGTRLLRATVGQMKNTATHRGRSLYTVHAELDDPERMTGEQSQKSGMVMNPNDRIKFWAANGFMEVVIPENGRVSHDWYIQPRLTKDSEPVDYLLFSMLPLHPELQKDREMSADAFLKLDLWKHSHYGFEAVPSSDLNELRNPDTDSSYLEMKRRIELAGKVKLVPLER